MRQFLAWLLGTYPSQPSSRSRSDRSFVVTEEAGMILGDPFLLHVLQSHLGLASILIPMDPDSIHTYSGVHVFLDFVRFQHTVYEPKYR